MPPVFASVPKVTVARAPPVPVPVAWETSSVAGRVPWHSVQEKPFERSVGVR